MKFKLSPSKVSLSAIALATVAAIATFAPSASAQTAKPTGLQGHYVGGGLSVGIDTEEGFDNIEWGGMVQGRYQLKAAPVSLRGSVLFDGDAAAIQPMATYDIATGNRSNVYLGGGGSFVVGNGETPLGDRSSFLLTAGAEGAINENWAVFGDVRWGIGGFDNGQAVSVQTGAAYRF